MADDNLAATEPTKTADEAVQHELKRIRRNSFFTLLIVLLTAIYFTRELLLPIVIAIILTLTLLPVVRFGERYRIPSGVTAVGVVVVAALVFSGLGYVLSGPAQTLAADAPRITEELQDKLGGILDQVSALRASAEEITGDAPAATMVDTNSDGVATTTVVTVTETGQAGLADQVVAGLASAGGAIGAGLVLAVFLLASGDFYHRRIIEAAPRLRDKKQALTIIRDIERQISRYLATIVLINAMLGIAVGLAMWLLSLPVPVVWGLLAFLLNFIPVVGSVLNVALVAAVSLVTFDTLGQALLAPAALAIFSLIESTIVTPLFIGRRLELNIVAQLVMIALWTWLWGIPGAILAVPFLVVVKAVTDNVESLQVISTFLAADPGTKAGEPPQKATTGPALETAPFRTQAEARADSPPA
jgi:predicted PurR-regulated permease PerM